MPATVKQASGPPGEPAGSFGWTQPPPLCRVRPGGSAPQLSQAAAGFTLLAQKGLLRLDVRPPADFRGEGLYMHGVLLEAQIGDKILAYDLVGGCEEIPDKQEFDRQLERVTFYFKRSYDSQFYQGMKNRYKLRPLGLNYYVTCAGNFFDRPGAPCRCTPEEYMSHNSYPAYRGLFLTRLWSPDGLRADAIRELHPHLSGTEAKEIAEEHIAQYERMNALRTGCVRACREALGDRFLGGLEDSEFARKAAPDLVLPAEMTGRAAFLNRLKENNVCVATEGPQGRVGWKMAEYCAAGRAVVTEPPRCALPGGFSRGRNYIEFTTPEQCVAQLTTLLNDIPGIHRMEAANFAYYNSYVRPDAMVLRTLREVWPAFPKDFEDTPPSPPHA